MKYPNMIYVTCPFCETESEMALPTDPDSACCSGLAAKLLRKQRDDMATCLRGLRRCFVGRNDAETCKAEFRRAGALLTQIYGPGRTR